MADLLPLPKWQFVDANGKPLAGGKVYTYAPGTTSPKATYADAAQTVANANPVILDARGEAVIYWDGLYKIRVTDANDAQIYEADNYGIAETPAAVYGANLVVNGDFEVDSGGDGLPDAWTVTPLGSATIELATDNPYSGGKALKFTNSAADANTGEARSQLVPVAPGDALFVSAYLTCNNADLVNSVTVTWWTDAQTQLSVSDVYNQDGNAGVYEQVSSTLTAPANAAFASVSVSGANTPGGGEQLGTTQFDRVEMQRPAEAAGDATTVQGWEPGDGALVLVSSVNGSSVFSDLSFERVVYDTSAFASIDTAKITIPSGVSKVRLSMNCAWTDGKLGEAYIEKNGAALFDGGQYLQSVTNDGTQHGATAVIEVVAGDEFQIFFSNQDSTSISVEGWFCIEVVA